MRPEGAQGKPRTEFNERADVGDRDEELQLGASDRDLCRNEAGLYSLEMTQSFISG